MSEPLLEELIRTEALDALHEVIDPEIGINIVDLGLVYGIDLEGRNLHVRLTMTTPACPLGEQIVREAEEALASVEGVENVRVELVWDPPWTPDRISDDAKDMLGWRRS